MIEEWMPAEGAGKTRADLDEILDEVVGAEATYTIIRDDRPVAVLISMSEYEALLDGLRASPALAGPFALYDE